MTTIGFWPTVRREVRRMASRKMYIGFMVIVPVCVVLFFVGLLSPGLPLRTPVAVIDQDHTSLSRQMTRTLGSNELLNVTQHLESYNEAMAAVRRGDAYGFFVIPANFERDAVSGRQPTVEFYNNMTYFVPGTLTFKGFMSVAVAEAAGLMKTKFAVLPGELTASLMQPVVVDQHPIGNPWMNYSIYLSPSFCFGALALLILLMTAFSVTMEIKEYSSTAWLSTAHGNITVAVTGKLLTQFVVWSIVGQFYLAMMFGYQHFPCGHPLTVSLGMELFILATQAFALTICCLVPNPRMSLTLCSLIGILSFSILGFSFPVQNMYGAVAIFSYLVPTRYMFLIYLFSGLNDFLLYYSRLYFAALLVFPIVGALGLGRLKRACANPVYVP